MLTSDCSARPAVKVRTCETYNLVAEVFTLIPQSPPRQLSFQELMLITDPVITNLIDAAKLANQNLNPLVGKRQHLYKLVEIRERDHQGTHIVLWFAKLDHKLFALTYSGLQMNGHHAHLFLAEGISLRREQAVRQAYLSVDMVCFESEKRTALRIEDITDRLKNQMTML